MTDEWNDPKTLVFDDNGKIPERPQPAIVTAGAMALILFMFILIAGFLGAMIGHYLWV